MNENLAVKDNKKVISIGIIITAIVILSSIVIYSSVIKPQKYSEYLDLGNKYLLEQNYEEAILAFEKAIKIDAKSTEARVGAAKAYIGINDVDNAVLYLEQAQNLDKTNESLLKEIINILIPVDSEVAYEFLDKFIDEVGEGNISEYINNLINESKEVPSDLKVSPVEGKYIKPISVKLDLDKMKIGHSYYYTLDGTNPNKGSNKYLGKIDIKESTTIKLIGYNKNNESTEVLTLEYVIDKNIIKDVKSIITEGENLIKNTTVGTEVGNISKEDKDKLQFIIFEAKDLVNKELVSYQEVSDIKGKLENGISEFKDSIIQPTDKSELSKNINKAQKLYENSTEGSSSGQYKVGSKKSLLEAINNAREVYVNGKNQETIDKQTNILKNAINNFENNKIESFSKQDAINQAIGRFGAVGYGEVEAGHELKTIGYKVVGNLKVENGVKYYSIEVSQVVKVHPAYEENGEWECDFPENRKFIVNSYENGMCY